MNKIAYHEAGHTIACLEHGLKFHSVTIVSKEEDNSLGHVILQELDFHPDYEVTDEVRIKVEKYIKTSLAGPIAETKYTGQINEIGASKDYQDSLDLASNLFGPVSVVNAFINFIQLDTLSLFTYLDETDEARLIHTNGKKLI